MHNVRHMPLANLILGHPARLHRLRNAYRRRTGLQLPRPPRSTLYQAVFVVQRTIDRMSRHLVTPYLGAYRSPRN